MSAASASGQRATTCACALLAVLALGGCDRSEPPAPPSMSRESPAPLATPTEASAMPTEIPSRGPSVALPRTIAGVSLGMSATDAEGKIGKLACHDNRAGFQVCSGQQRSDDVHNLELYLVHGHVVSVSYESAASANVADTLTALVERYGRPSLSGLRQRDTNGRVHEIYGWKDDDSLYSVRFMWGAAGGADPKLLGTAIALWDRKGYQEWEAEMKQRQQPTPGGDESHGPI